MRLKTFFATLMMLTVGTAPVYASGKAIDLPVSASGGGRFIPVPRHDVPDSAPVMVAQATNSMQLEEQIRQLMGKVEELNFQVLQLQEQMRKMQEDNEFRFQELENSKQGRLENKGGNDVAASPDGAADNDATVSVDGVGEAAASNAPPAEAADIAGTDNGTGAPPKELGTITFDENGKAIGGSIEQPADQTGDMETQTAALPAGDDAQELYRISYDHVLAGEYQQAEAGFRQHVETYPTDGQTADARFWLGESLAAQGKHREAAEVLLDAQRDFPKSGKAPEMLLKLGVSLAALNNKDVACATFRQVQKKYPKAGAALMERVNEEQSKAGC